MGLTYDRIFAPIVNTVLESCTAPEQRTRARAIRQQMAVCEINMLVTRDLSENTCANRLTANRYRGINVTRDAFKCGLSNQLDGVKLKVQHLQCTVHLYSVSPGYSTD